MHLVPNQSRKVFLVEDDVDISSSIREILESEGYAVESAGDGDAALEQLRAMPEKPGLILLDLRLPGKDGVQFRQEQREDARISQIPVVILSADGKLSEKTSGLGAQHLLKKPVDLDELLDTVKEFLH